MSAKQHSENSDPVHILLVEDNPGDVMLTEMAFKDINLDVKFSFAYDGGQALAMLKEQSFNQLGMPEIVLLDLNLPKMHGHEVLKQIKSSSQTKKIPVIVLSSSSADKDIEDSYGENANAYLVKPKNQDEYAEMAKQIEGFWFNCAKMPAKAG